MVSFTFVTPPRLVMEWDAATNGRLATEAARLGRKPLVLAGRTLGRSGILPRLVAVLTTAGLSPVVYEGIGPEPSIDAVQAALDAARVSRADCLIAVGGGSVLDVAKGAALAPFDANIRDYFGGAIPVPENGGLPLLAVPTTAGTGSEATWVGVYTDTEQKRKASIRGGAMMPTVAVLDAALTVSCPSSVTAFSGMDAFVQALESLTSVGANPLTSALARPAVEMTWQNLETAFREPQNRPAREAVLLGSYMAGAALNTSRLGLVHGLAHPVGAITGAPHGLICGLLMPAVMRFNNDNEQTRAVYETLPVLPGVSSNLSPVERVSTLLQRLSIPTRLRDIGVRESDLDTIARDAMTSGSTKANPRPVSLEDARQVAANAL